MGRFVCIVSVLLYSACAPVWNTRSADYTNGVYDPELLFYKKEKVEPLEEIGEEDLAGGNFIHPLHLRSGYIPSYDYSSAFHRGRCTHSPIFISLIRISRSGIIMVMIVGQQDILLRGTTV